jgi:5-formyltetrahydrofolate cyclo-ligase
LPHERSALRKLLRERRTALPAPERISAAQSLVAQLEQIPEFLTDRRIAGYWAIGGELPLLGLMPGLRERGQDYCLPVVDSERLRFAPWRPGIEISMNRFGIPEPVVPTADLLAPEQMDVVLLPLLGFDRRGNRLGFGGAAITTAASISCASAATSASRFWSASAMSCRKSTRSRRCRGTCVWTTSRPNAN